MSFREVQVPKPAKKPVDGVSEPLTEEKTQPIERPTDAPDEGSDLLATYQDETGIPYTAEYFDIRSMWSEPELAEPLGYIESYLQEQVTDKKLANTTKAGTKLLKQLEKGAQTSEMDDTSRRIDKMIAYIEFKKVVNG